MYVYMQFILQQQHVLKDSSKRHCFLTTQLDYVWTLMFNIVWQTEEKSSQNSTNNKKQTMNKIM